MTKIHNSAIIGKNCKIGDNVFIGPYSVIEDNVKIGNDNIIKSSVYIGSGSDIGSANTFFPFCSIGTIPQDLKYKGEKSRLIIGSNNTFREHCTANLGTKGDRMETLIGNSSLFMTGAHIAHDCIIGNRTVFANQATLGGHVCVDDYAVIGGISAIHQFCKIGKLAMIGGMSAVENDVIPYSLAIGNRAKIAGINIVGLKRANFSKDEIREYSKIVDKIFTGESISKEKLKYSDTKNQLVNDLLLFLENESSRGLCKYAK